MDLGEVPVHCNVLFDSVEDALAAPRGRLTLGFCETCGLICNSSFDPALTAYSDRYENSLLFSPRFREYAQSLVERLLREHDLRGKYIVEIGCGGGELLAMLCDRGGNRGVGFDPSQDPVEAGHGPGSMRIVPDFYSERYADRSADFICCRHVLEHLDRPRELLASLRSMLGDRPDVAVYFEVPDAEYMLRAAAVWDLIYEHPSYFSAATLDGLFEEMGFEVLRVASEFGGQYVGIDATPSSRDRQPRSRDDDAIARVADRLTGFRDAYRTALVRWDTDLQGLLESGQRVAVWGAGSKGVAFLNCVPSARRVGAVVDINPRKQGKFVPGTGQEIVEPEWLAAYRPHVVVLMNPIYREEVTCMLDAMGLSPALRCP
jgi:hypothetical protein